MLFLLVPFFFFFYLLIVEYICIYVYIYIYVFFLGVSRIDINQIDMLLSFWLPRNLKSWLKMLAPVSPVPEC